MQNFIVALFVLMFTEACSSFGQSTESITGNTLVDARQAFNAGKHKKAYTLFSQLWEDPEAAEADRLDAARHMVMFNWRFYGKNAFSHSLLDKLESIESEVSKAYVLRARMLVSEGAYKKAIVASKKAVVTAASEAELLSAAVAYGTSVLDMAKADIFTGARLSSDSMLELEEVYQQLGDWLEDKQDNLKLARLHLGHALLLNEGEEALRSWRLFYRLSEADEAHPTLVRSMPALERAFISRTEAPNDPHQAKTLIKGLAESGFVEYAIMLNTLIIGSARSEDPQIAALQDYYEYLQRLERSTTAFYLGTVSAKKDIYDLNSAFKTDSEWLWNRLAWEGNKPAYSQKRFIQTVRERFKGLVLFNTVSGYYGLHVGQVILDDKRTIRQYDQTAEFRYTLIDHVLSNGYITWLTDGENAVGGWASNNGSFVQVRTDLNSEITKLWSMHRDEVESRKVADQIKRMSANEEEMARQNPYDYLPGLQYRLILRETGEVIDSLAQTGMDENQLRYAFIRYIERIAEDAKIYAHEGRHSIDMKYGYTSGSENLEYTAKLSEIYFAEKPFFFLGTLIGSDMGNGTAHGEANLKLVKGLVGWMEAHRSEIAGFDASRPTFPQIGKMSDAQLKTAVRSLDPLAK